MDMKKLVESEKVLRRTLAESDVKKILSAIDSASPDCKLISEKIFEYKEVGQKEVKSAALLMEQLRKIGFTVAGGLKVPADLSEDEDGIAKTAFCGKLQGKGTGPTIAIMLEYDALSNGHSCGHNLIAASGLLAAAGLAKFMADTPGQIIVIGTPDEERGALGRGKVALLEGGNLDGSDIVLITHPGDGWNAYQKIFAMKRATFIFRGKAAHATTDPHKGINALRAVLLTFNNIDMLREHFRQDVRIHGVIKKGGESTNIVPDLAEAEFAVRALDSAMMKEVYQKLVNCAKAAELVSGTKLEFREPRIALEAPIPIPAYSSMVMGYVRSLGVPESEIKEASEFGSSDLGNVGHEFPTVNLQFKIVSDETPKHSDAFRQAAASDEGWKATIIAGKAIALTAYDLLTHPEKVKLIQDQFHEMKVKRGE